MFSSPWHLKSRHHADPRTNKNIDLKVIQGDPRWSKVKKNSINCSHQQTSKVIQGTIPRSTLRFRWSGELCAMAGICHQQWWLITTKKPGTQWYGYNSWNKLTKISSESRIFTGRSWVSIGINWDSSISSDFQRYLSAMFAVSVPPKQSCYLVIRSLRTWMANDSRTLGGRFFVKIGNKNSGLNC